MCGKNSSKFLIIILDVAKHQHREVIVVPALFKLVFFPDSFEFCCISVGTECFAWRRCRLGLEENLLGGLFLL